MVDETKKHNETNVIKENGGQIKEKRVRTRIVYKEKRGKIKRRTNINENDKIKRKQRCTKDKNGMQTKREKAKKQILNV